MTLRKAIVRLAHSKPELRPHLLPLLQETRIAAQVKLPRPSKSAWQLYDLPGAGRAAQALSRALKAAVTEMGKGLRKLKRSGNKRAINDVIWKAFNKHMDPEMSRQADFGASDSEPRYVAQQAMSDAARSILDDPDIDFYDLW